MTRSEAISALQAHATAIRACGATGVYLFGSTGRDEAGTTTTRDSLHPMLRDGIERSALRVL